MKCPHCKAKIGWMSKEMSGIGKTKVCPHCGEGVKFGIRPGRFTLVFVVVAVVAILMDRSSAVSAGVAGGIAAVFGMGLKSGRS